MFKNINSGLIASRASFLTDRNRLLYTKLITNSSGQQFYSAATGYVYHIFTQPGTFEIHTHGYVDMMLVGGGGGGGGLAGTFNSYWEVGSAGGGAGGVNHQYNMPMPVSTYTVKIGAGGGVGPNNANILSNPDQTDNDAGRGTRGGYTQIIHNMDGPGVYYDSSGSPTTAPLFFQEWGTRVQPGGGSPGHLDGELIGTNLSTITHAVSAVGGGGGGYSYTRQLSNAYPTTSPHFLINPQACDGDNGGSHGGDSHYHISHTGFDHYTPPTSPDFHYPLRLNASDSENPQGNAGGNTSGFLLRNSNATNGAGGGGGAGAPGGAGTNTPQPNIMGYGGIGVPAFGGDIGIPQDFGTDGPAQDPTAFVDPNNIFSGQLWGRTKTRWFGGGGFGGNNGFNNFSYGYYSDDLGTSNPSVYWARHGYIGGGAAYFPPTGAPVSYRSGTIKNAAYRNGRANTGGGGAGGDSYYYPTYNLNIAPGGSGGSGIVIIRYQAAH